MNWYNFQNRFPQVFGEFCAWYEQSYPVEYQKHTAPVLSAERLLEFFKKKGYPVNSASLRDPLGGGQNDVYKAFEQMENEAAEGDEA